ncbi:MAG TPA: YihY/virulence factor BrkB family protein [Bryobacteraceae bacterium]|nr:YihY/virulence factor BrkB family protein [Bryobacteraceae bacterium]
MRLTPRNFFWLLHRSIFAAFGDGCLGIAKGAAYSALLSFFPILTSAATILVQTRAEFVSRFLAETLDQIVPPGSEGLVMQQFRVTGARPISLLIVAFLISIWAASGVIKSLMEGFQIVYRVPRSRRFLQTQGVAVAMVLLAAFPLVCATALVLFGTQVESTMLAWLKVDPILSPLSGLMRAVSRGARYLLAFATTVAVTCTLYLFGPYRRQRWRFVWPGAVVATVFWLLATTGFAWYVRNMGHYNVMYGSIGAGIALLVWMYLMAVIALIGCAFNAEYERASANPAEMP